MERCEICGKIADKHHIVYRSQGGFDFSLNYKYLCDEHHRGKLGPHKNKKVDLEYKLEMQKKLFNILTKEYYNLSEIINLLDVNKCQAKKMLYNLKPYKEGFKKIDIIKKLMGGKVYEYYLENYELALEEIYDNIV